MTRTRPDQQHSFVETVTDDVTNFEFWPAPEALPAPVRTTDA